MSVPATGAAPTRVLIVRLSSLGDLVHAFPLLGDVHAALPGARIDWVCEEAFAPMLGCVDGLERIIPVALRRWRRDGLWGARAEMRRFVRELRATPYDAVIDLQGLIKSAVVARMARLSRAGRRFGLGNRNDGAAYEPLARLAYDTPVVIAPRTHVVDRSRLLVARALGYTRHGPPLMPWRLAGLQPGDRAWTSERGVLLVHGSAKAVKQLDTGFWVELGVQLAKLGWSILLPWGTRDEERRAAAIAAGIAGKMPTAAVQVLPRLPLDRLLAVIAGLAGCIGLDTGLAHIAATLGRPTVQLFLEQKAWRAAIDWMPLTAVIQAAEGHPPTVTETVSAWLQVAAPLPPKPVFEPA